MTGQARDARKEREGAVARLDWLDAAKGIGILLVVVGHVWTRGAVRDAIYAFHMPLFFLLAGYVARPRPMAVFARTQLRTMAVPYAAFLLTLALADQLIEHMRGHLPIFRSWGDAVWSLLIGGSELDGPFTIFWFIPCLAVARFILVGGLNHGDGKDSRGLCWIAAMAVALGFGLWIGALTDFSPLGLLSVPVALVFLWLGALWRSLPDDRLLVTGALIAGGVQLLLTAPQPLDMKAGDYGNPPLSLPLAVLLSLGVAGLARLFCRWRPLYLPFAMLGRRSLVIMYCHVPVVHYAAPYCDEPVLLALAVLLPLAIYEGLARTIWGRRYFLGQRSGGPRKILR